MIRFDKTYGEERCDLKYGVEAYIEENKLKHRVSDSTYSPYNSVDDDLDITLPARTLFTGEYDTELYKTIFDLLPAVVSELGKQEKLHSDRIVKMLKLMAEGRFPFENIAFLLFEDVVEWLSCSDVRKIRYSEEVRLFWATGHKLMNNKFL